MTETPDDIDPEENFEGFVEWVDEELEIVLDEGYDLHLGNCPKCGINEYFIHVYFEDGVDIMTNCIWCGYTARAL